MNKKNELLRGIPQVEKILQDSDISALVHEIGQPVAAEIIREKTEQFRSLILSGSTPEPADLKQQIIAGIKRDNALCDTSTNHFLKSNPPVTTNKIINGDDRLINKLVFHDMFICVKTTACGV